MLMRTARMISQSFYLNFLKMKIIFLDRSFEPRFKNGGVGSFLAPATSMLSGVYAAQQSGHNVSMQLGAQKEENAINRDWSTSEAEKARKYNTSERLAAQQYGLDVMNMQNEYNSPAAQAQRLRDANINPVVAMSGNVQNVSAQSQPSTPQTSPMPSPAGGLSPVSFQPADIQIGQLMNGVSSMFKNFAEAKKMGVDTDIMSRSAEWLVKSNMLDAQGKDLINSWQLLNNEILENTKDSQIHKLWNESNKSYNDWLLSGRELNRQDIIDQSMKIQNRLNEALENYHGQNALLLSMEVRSFNQKLDSFLKLNDAQTEEARESARVSKANASQIEFYNEIRSSPSVKRSLIEQLQELGKQAQNQTLITDRQYHLMDWQIEQLKKATNNYEIQMWCNIINQTLGTAANALGEYTRFGLAKKFLNGSKGSFDVNAGRGYHINDDGILLFKNLK